jgi:hypothetical protein
MNVRVGFSRGQEVQSAAHGGDSSAASLSRWTDRVTYSGRLQTLSRVATQAVAHVRTARKCQSVHTCLAAVRGCA